jgi:putative nucleotidyltransferase with HDIG domain
MVTLNIHIMLIQENIIMRRVLFLLVVLIEFILATGAFSSGNNAETAEYIFMEGLKKYSMSDYSSAIEDFAKVYAVDKENKKNIDIYYKALVRQGDIEYNRENFPEARRLYARAIGLVGEDEGLLWKLKTIDDIGEHVRMEKLKSEAEIKLIVKAALVSGMSLVFVFLIVILMVAARRKKDNTFTSLIAKLPSLDNSQKNHLRISLFGQENGMLPAVRAKDLNTDILNEEIIPGEINSESAGSLLLLAHIIDSKTKRQEHSARVAGHAFFMASLLNDSGIDPSFVKRAALLHDIGFLSIKGTFNVKEHASHAENSNAILEIIRLHTTRGAKIIQSFGMSDSFSDCVLYHHERYDSSGYPSGLAGENIPLVALVIGAAEYIEGCIQDNENISEISAHKTKTMFGEKIGSVLSLLISRLSGDTR